MTFPRLRKAGATIDEVLRDDPVIGACVVVLMIISLPMTFGGITVLIVADLIGAIRGERR